MEGPRLLRLVGAGFAVAAGLFLGTATYVFRDTSRFVAAASQAEGKVTKLIERAYWDSKQDRQSATYRPQVDYRVSGTTYTFESKSGSNPPAFRVGERMTVLYPPDSPAQGRLSDFSSLWLLPLIFFTLGGTFGLVAIVLLLVSWRGKEATAARRARGDLT